MWVKQNKKGLMKGWWRQEIKYAIMFIFVKKLWLDAPPIACLFLKKFSKSTSKSRRQIFTDSKPKNTKRFSRPDDLIGFYTKGCGAFKN